MPKTTVSLPSGKGAVRDSGVIALGAVALKDAIQGIAAHIPYMHWLSAVLADWDEVAVAGNVVLGMFLWRTLADRSGELAKRLRQLKRKYGHLFVPGAVSRHLARDRAAGCTRPAASVLAKTSADKSRLLRGHRFARLPAPLPSDGASRPRQRGLLAA